MPTHQHFLAPELANPLAAIDIGTNSIRLIIAEGLRNGKYRILDDEKDATRIGAALASTGKLAPEAIERAIETLRRMKTIAEGFEAYQLRAIGTCAVREAENGQEFVRRVQEEVGLSIEVISAKQEARYSFSSIHRHFELGEIPVVTADIGGGSTEIVAACNGVIEEIFATNLGAVRLTEQYEADQALSARKLERLLAGIDQVLQERVGKPPFLPQLLIGTGGTFTTLGAIIMAENSQSETPMRGYTVKRSDVRHLLHRLAEMTVSQRKDLSGLSADRADIFLGGLAIIDRLMQYFQVNRLQIHTGGVRDGLLLEMVDDLLSEQAKRPQVDRDVAIRKLAGVCGVDLPHSEHVSMLAGELYDQLVELKLVPEGYRQLLTTAAILQDVGYLINYDDHHKHSYHLIMNSDLSGFTADQLQLIANIARYHRGSPPKRKHVPFRQLSDSQQQLVKQLSAILRLAGGMDRSHTRQVLGLSVQQIKDGLQLTLLSQEHPEVDLWGVHRRSEYFEEMFDLKLHLLWDKPQHLSAQPSTVESP